RNAFFSLDGTRVISSEDRTARLWDLATGKQIFTLHHDGPGTRGVLSPSGSRVLTLRPTKLWDAASGEQIAKFIHAGLKDAAFSPDGTRIVTASDDHTARLWDSDTGIEIITLRHGGAVNSAAFSPDGKRVVTVSEDRTARVWDVLTGR